MPMTIRKTLMRRECERAHTERMQQPQRPGLWDARRELQVQLKRINEWNIRDEHERQCQQHAHYKFQSNERELSLFGRTHCVFRFAPFSALPAARSPISLFALQIKSTHRLRRARVAAQKGGIINEKKETKKKTHYRIKPNQVYILAFHIYYAAPKMRGGNTEKSDNAENG